MQKISCSGLSGIVLILLLVVACREEKLPPGVLSQTEFSSILVEVYLAETRMNQNSMPRDSALQIFLSHEKKMFERLGVSDSVVRITYQYYVDHPQQLEKIYDSVVDTLSLREHRLSTTPVVDTVKNKKGDKFAVPPR